MVMGVYIITIFIFSLASWIFQQYWKEVLKFFYYILQKSVNVVKKIIVATRRAGKAVMMLYKRLRNGKVYKTEFTEEEISEDDIPEGLREELDIHEEVIVKKGDIDPTEF